MLNQNHAIFDMIPLKNIIKNRKLLSNLQQIIEKIIISLYSEGIFDFQLESMNDFVRLTILVL